jgi:VCBS repeat-containing protein
MADYDLAKVDKADDKYGKFIIMLQVKYGYTRQQARDELNKLWTGYETQEGLA